MIKAFIFDLDGTLLDSMYAWKNVGSRYLAHKGVQAVPPDLEERLKTMSLLGAAKYFISEFSFPQTPEEIVAEFNELAAEQYRNVFQPKPGVVEFLAKHAHMKMCVATATERPLAEMALKRLDWMKYFEFIITSGEAGSSKRSPDIFLQAAQKLGAGVAEAIVFEDSPHAVKSAKAAGFYTVGVQDDFYEAEATQILDMADAYVESLLDFTMP